MTTRGPPNYLQTLLQEYFEVIQLFRILAIRESEELMIEKHSWQFISVGVPAKKGLLIH